MSRLTAPWQRLLAAAAPAPWRATGQALLALALGLALAAALPLDRWLLARHDLQQRWLAPDAPADAARVVDVDDASVRRLGGWPLPRHAYVPAGEWLVANGARAVVFNLLLTDPRDGDTAFAGWLARAGAPVVLAAAGVPEAADAAPLQAAPAGCQAWPVGGWQLPVWARAEGPSAPLLAVQQVGALSLPVPADDVLRQWPLWQQAGPLALPILPLAAVQAVLPRLAAALPCDTATPPSWLAGAGLAAPTRAGHTVWPVLARTDTWAAPAPLWRVIDAAAGRLGQAEAAALSAWVSGRVVFIGGSAALGDTVLTAQGALPGGVVSAATYDALAHGRLLRPALAEVSAALFAVGLLPWAAGTLRRRPRPLAELAWLVAAVLLLLVLDSLLAAAGHRAHIGAPLAALGAWALVALGLAHVRATDERRRLQLARSAADASSQGKGEFLAHVGHELRTPLNALLGAADMLAQSPLDAQQSRHVGLFRGAGQELLQMLNDLLDLSKMEAGRLSLERAPFSLTRLVAQQVLLFEARAVQKGLQLQVESAPDLPDVVIGDGARLAQVLRNLLSNAVKFTSVGSVTLAVGRSADGQRVRFEVRDTGIGVPPARASAIFAPFTQADDDVARHYGGTGLGLAIVRRLVRAMGGLVGVSSREGLGSNFYLELPLPATTATPRRLLSEAPPLAMGDLPPLPPTRMLLADDNPLNIALATAFLEGSGHQLDVAHDGALALRRFEAKPYPIVLLDLNMPVMGGLQAARAIRALEQRRNLPGALLVAVTAQTDAADARAALDAGFDVHLPKPYSRRQLMNVLARRLLATGPHGADGGPLSSPTTMPSSWPPEDSRLHAISQLPDSDLPEALDRLGSPALYRRVLDSALESFARFDARLARALDAVPCDLDRAQRLAHDLKSSAATLGLLGLASDAARLEAALAAAVTPTEDASVAQGRLLLLQRLQSLREVLAQGPETVPDLSLAPRHEALRQASGVTVRSRLL